MEISKAEASSVSGMSHAHHNAKSKSEPNGSDSELRGAEILVKALQAEGVKYVWGYPGGAVLHIYDAFFKQDTIQHVLVRHEQAAVHAADGYARATAKSALERSHRQRGATRAACPIRLLARHRQRRERRTRHSVIEHLLEYQSDSF